MPNKPMSNRAGGLLVKFVITFMILQVIFTGYVFYQSYTGRNHDITTQREACKNRGHTSNLANADFQTAHTTYISKVVLASSVHEDVKQAARTAIETFKRTSGILRDLAAQDCNKVYPKASLLP